MEQVLDSEELNSTQNLDYAGFWIRVGAYIIDGILMWIAQAIIMFAILGGMISGEDMAAGQMPDTGKLVLTYILIMGIGVAYFVGMESSAKQATLGKLAVGIKVGKENGEKLSFGNALGRYLSKILSAITLCIGFMMVGWDKKKQGMHDKIAGTYVFKK